MPTVSLAGRGTIAYQWTYKYDDIFPAYYRFLPVG